LILTKLQNTGQMMKNEKRLSDKLMDLLKEYSKAEYEYINPYFLSDISRLLREYYKLEDDEVDDWIQGMFSA